MFFLSCEPDVCMFPFHSFRHPLVIQAIRLAGHRLVFRAPYWSVDGSIEYLFNTIQLGLTNLLYRIYSDNAIEEMNNLKEQIRRIIRLQREYVKYFEHVGFRFDDL